MRLLLLAAIFASSWTTATAQSANAWLINRRATATNYTSTATDWYIAATATLTNTLPLAASVRAGQAYVIKSTGAGNTVTIRPSGADTIDGTAGDLTLTAQAEVTLISNGGTNWEKTMAFQSSYGTTINPTDGYLPYRSNATTFGDSPLFVSTNRTVTQTSYIAGTNTLSTYAPSDGVALASVRNAASGETGSTGVYLDGQSTGTGANATHVEIVAFGGLSASSSLSAVNGAGTATYSVDAQATPSGIAESKWIRNGEVYSRIGPFQGVVADESPFFLSAWFDHTTNSIFSITNSAASGANVAFKVSALSGYTGAGTLFLSDDGTYRTWPASLSAYLASNGTTTSATLANLSISASVISGKKYSFTLVLFCANSVAADGVKIDFDGGTATATNFRAHATGHDAALFLSQQVSALATDIAAATVTGDAQIEVNGSFEPSGSGTLIPRFAVNAATTGTLTVYRGSNLVLTEIP